MAYAKPIAPGDLTVLDARLRAFYDKDGPHFGDAVALDQEGFTGLGAVQHLLSFVLSQPKSAGSSIRRRNVYVLAWAASLARRDERADEPFLRRQIYYRLAELLRRHRQRTESRSHVVEMFDALRLWTPRELPFLARAAGRAGVLAITYAERASPFVVSDATDESDVLRMVAAIREFKTPSDEQALLLMQSGFASRQDQVRLLRNLLHRFTEAGPKRRAELSRPGSLPRVLTELLMDDYVDEDPLTSAAVAEVRRESEAAGGPLADLDRRRAFLLAFAKDALFERPSQRLRVNESVAPSGPRPKRTLEFATEGNVIHVNFDCNDHFTK